jgi:chromosome partitioning protein
MAAECVAFLNQKGGVGKTSTCHHLSGAFAYMGKRVLLVDNDPQSSLTQGLWGPQVTRDLDPNRTIDAVYRHGAAAAQVVHRTGLPWVDLIPGSRHAGEFNNAMPHRASRELQVGLRDVVREAAADYDLVVIDCAPNLNLCSWAALVAAHHLVVPLQPEDYGAMGIIDVRDSVDQVVAGPNPGLNLLGYLITMQVARKSIHKLYEETLRAEYGDLVFAARVPHAADFPEAIAHRKTAAQYKPRGAAAGAIKAVAEELLARIAAARCVSVPATGEAA